MFTEKTVLILGAEASWHYGYPTGEGLVEEAAKMARAIADYLDEMLKLWEYELRWQSPSDLRPMPKFVSDHCDDDPEKVVDVMLKFKGQFRELADRLDKVNPLIIDYFLSWNYDLEAIGRMVITAVILDRERHWRDGEVNKNHLWLEAKSTRRLAGPNSLVLENFKDDWIRFLVHKLAFGCRAGTDDLTHNKLKIITFNYDTSLERELKEALSSIDLLSSDDVSKLLSEEHILHMYGAIRPTSQSPKQLDEGFARLKSDIESSFLSAKDKRKNEDRNALRKLLEQFKIALDAACDAAKGIRVMGHHDKDGDGSETSKAREWINQAKYVYLLVYGFDKLNNKRLGLGNRDICGLGKSVRYTNFRQVGSVSRRANVVFDPVLDLIVSTKNTYDALEQDFDAFDA